MSQPTDLMGVGMPYSQANLLAVTPISLVSGASTGTVVKTQGRETILNVTATSGGNSVYLTSPSSVDGAMLGDCLFVVNRSSDGSSSVVIKSDAGVQILGSGTSTIATTGVSVSVGNCATFFWVTSSLLAFHRGI